MRDWGADGKGVEGGLDDVVGGLGVLFAGELVGSGEVAF